MSESEVVLAMAKENNGMLTTSMIQAASIVIIQAMIDTGRISGYP